MRWAALVAIHSCAHVAAAGPDYRLQEGYLADGVEEFFNKWNFYSKKDPSSGSVEYVDHDTARGDGLAKALDSDGSVAYIGVDATQVSSTLKERQSVRIHSKARYNSGLFIVRIDHMPTGCGTWPAFWMYGEDPDNKWPKWGEYDIIEGQHNSNSTITTLHTDVGCTQQDVVSGVHFTQRWNLGATGKPTQNCDVAALGQFQNQGCSQSGPPGSMGPVFNTHGGGTYAADWDPDAMQIRTWFWPAGSEPEDITQGSPRPQSWGTPYSYFSLDPMYCGPGHFHDMRLVFNVNLCGDLGDPTFAEGCPAEAKKMSCEEYVSDPENMKEAYWAIRSLDVYERIGPVPTTTKLPIAPPTRNPYIIVGDAGAEPPEPGAPPGSGGTAAAGQPKQPPAQEAAAGPRSSGPVPSEEGPPVSWGTNPGAAPQAGPGDEVLSLAPPERSAPAAPAAPALEPSQLQPSQPAAATLPQTPPPPPPQQPPLQQSPYGMGWTPPPQQEQPQSSGALRGGAEEEPGSTGSGVPAWCLMLGGWAAALGALGLILVFVTERRRAHEGEADGPVSYQEVASFGGRMQDVLSEWWELICLWWRKLCDWVQEVSREHCPRAAELIGSYCEKLRAALAPLWAALCEHWQTFCSWAAGVREQARASQSYSRLRELTSSCNAENFEECMASPLQACEWCPPTSQQEVTAIHVSPPMGKPVRGRLPSTQGKYSEELIGGRRYYNQGPLVAARNVSRESPRGLRQTPTDQKGGWSSPYGEQTLPGQHQPPPRIWSFGMQRSKSPPRPGVPQGQSFRRPSFEV